MVVGLLALPLHTGRLVGEQLVRDLADRVTDSETVIHACPLFLNVSTLSVP